MKHVLITGGVKGLGKVTARKLLGEGFRVTILNRGEEQTKAVAQELGCNYAVADVADMAQIQKAIRRAGNIDILINNAGLWVQGPIDENDPQRIKDVIDVNVTGSILCAHAVIPGMKKQGHGRIINIGSKLGLYSKAERAVYAASKWAITGFSRSLEDELKPFGIAVTCFNPNAVNRTELFASAGLDREITTGIDADTVADAIVYICKLPDAINVSEMSIGSLTY